MNILTDLSSSTAQHPKFCDPRSCRLDTLDGVPVLVHSVQLYRWMSRALTLIQVVELSDDRERVVRTGRPRIMGQGSIAAGFDAEQARLFADALAYGAELASTSALPVTVR